MRKLIGWGILGALVVAIVVGAGVLSGVWWTGLLSLAVAAVVCTLIAVAIELIDG